MFKQVKARLFKEVLQLLKIEGLSKETLGSAEELLARVCEAKEEKQR